jgi:hypothetical protein
MINKCKNCIHFKSIYQDQFICELNKDLPIPFENEDKECSNYNEGKNMNVKSDDDTFLLYKDIICSFAEKYSEDMFMNNKGKIMNDAFRFAKESIEYWNKHNKN